MYVEPMLLSPYGSYVHPYVVDSLAKNRYMNHWRAQLNKYVLRALAYIQAILELLRSCSPFFKQYGKVISEIPKLYQLFRAFQELNQAEGNKRTSQEKFTFTDDRAAKPRLFI